MSRKTGRILIVDDEPQDVATIERAGTALSLEVATLDHTKAFERLVTDWKPDIVVLDIRMPRLTGYEAARVFNRRPSSTRPILVAITAWAGESGKLRAEMSGFDHYIAKPAEPSEVLQLLKRL